MTDAKDAERLAEIRALCKSTQLSEPHSSWVFLLRLLDERNVTITRLQLQVDRLTIKTPREQAMRETIHGQGLSMVAMGKELREKDATIAHLTQERDDYRDRIRELEQERDSLNNQNRSLAIECDKWMRSSRQPPASLECD